MENNTHIQIKKTSVLHKESQINVLRTEINNLFEKKTSLLQESSGIITKEVDQVQRDIDKKFDTKSTLESEVKVLRIQILDLVLNA